MSRFIENPQVIEQLTPPVDVILSELSEHREFIAFELQRHYWARAYGEMESSKYHVLNNMRKELKAQGQEERITPPRPFLGITRNGYTLIGTENYTHPNLWEDYLNHNKLGYVRYQGDPDSSRSGSIFTLLSHPDISIVKFDKELDSEKEKGLTHKIIERLERQGYQLILDGSFNKIYPEPE